MDLSIKYKLKNKSLIKDEDISGRPFIGGCIETARLSVDAWINEKEYIPDTFYINETDSWFKIYKISKTENDKENGDYISLVHENWIEPASSQIQFDF